MMDDQKESKKTYASGAVRSEVLPRFRDIDYGFLRRVAEAFSEGAERYDKGFPPGFKNWKKGDVEFAVDVLDHMLNHALLLKEQLLAQLTGAYIFDAEDHLGHLGANLVMLDYFERRGFFRIEEDDFCDPSPQIIESKKGLWTANKANHVEATETVGTPPSDDGVTQLDIPDPGSLTSRIKQALGLS